MTDRDSGDQELRRVAEATIPGPWFHVQRPWISVPGYVWTAEDPHAGTLVADCNGTAEPINFAEYIAAVSPDVLLGLLREKEALRSRLRRLVEARDAYLAADDDGPEGHELDAAHDDARALLAGERLDA